MGRKSSTYLCWSSVAILWITAAYVYFSDCFASEEHNNSWDLLGITLNWPETSCRQMNRTHHLCHESSIFMDGLFTDFGRIDSMGHGHSTVPKINSVQMKLRTLCPKWKRSG